MSDDLHLPIELDDTSSAARAAAAATVVSDERPLELDLVACATCGQSVPLNDAGVCRACHVVLPSVANVLVVSEMVKHGLADGLADEQSVMPMARALDAADDLARIAAESSAVASAPRPPALGTIRTSGFIAATGNTGNTENVDSGNGGAALATIRAMSRRNADAALAARPAAQPATIAPEPENAGRVQLRAGDIVAGAAAAGHGVIVGWRGQNDLLRRDLIATLERANLPVKWAPDAASARAQAGRAVGMLGSDGFDVKAEKKSQRQVVECNPYDHRWTVGSVNHSGSVGDKYGDIVIVATLTGDDLRVEGDQDVADKILADYRERLGQEIYRSSDVSAWLSKILRTELDAVRFGVGWYVPRKHADTAARLCEAFFNQGWGVDWIVPALPVATSEQLRAGILRALTDEVAAVLHQLANERDTAVTRENREDIGTKRAQTFLRQLREISGRVIAYGSLLGEDRVTKMRAQVKAAMVELESSLGEDEAGIIARFGHIWDEIALDRQNNGGTL